jgi:predicted nucleic acid-binding protein
VLQEVLQGIKDDGILARVREGFMALPLIAPALETETFHHAAGIYRTGRRLGHTIRSSVDCLIAAIAIENKITVWHRDRDFAAIAKFTDLRVTGEYT